jgi:hypothetical protein
MAISFAVPQTEPLDFARDFPRSGHLYVDVRSASWAGRSLAFMVVSSEAVQKDACTSERFSFFMAARYF